MPNPTPARYTVQIGPTYTVETAAELTAWARQQGRSVSDLWVREIDGGMPRWREVE